MEQSHFSSDYYISTILLLLILLLLEHKIRCSLLIIASSYLVLLMSDMGIMRQFQDNNIAYNNELYLFTAIVIHFIEVLSPSTTTPSMAAFVLSFISSNLWLRLVEK